MLPVDKRIATYLTYLLSHSKCHTNEGRISRLAPVTIGSYSRLSHWAFVFPGATVSGNNLIHPLTLIMKNDHLPKNTEWSGCPATVSNNTDESHSST